MNSKERTHAALAGRPLEAKGHGNYAAILIYPQIDADFSAFPPWRIRTGGSGSARADADKNLRPSEKSVDIPSSGDYYLSS